MSGQFVTVMNHETDEDGITRAYPMEIEVEDDSQDGIVGYCSVCNYPVLEGTEFEEVGNEFIHAPHNCGPDINDYEPDVRDTETNFGGYSTGWGDDTPIYDEYYGGMGDEY